MKKLLYIFVYVVMITPLYAQQDQTITIVSGGIQRSFDVHLPSVAPPANLPALLCYHGTGGTSADMKFTTGFNVFADQNNFIVVYPQAVVIGNDIQWNVYVDDQPGHGGLNIPDAPDDVLFTRDIIKYLSLNYNIDMKRVFASGLSNGGFMCYALSMLAADDIKAIAPVAANMWADANYLNQIIMSGTVKPMPVMHVHGTADGVVDYPDPDNTPKDYEEYPLFISSRVCNALTYSQVVPIMNGVDKLVFCGPPIEVFLIRIKDMGHAWTNGVYPTSSEIVKFFGLENKPNAVRQSIQPEQFLITPNPANTSVRVQLTSDATVQMFSLLGNTVYSTEHRFGTIEIPSSNLPAGMYIVRVLPVNSEPIMMKCVVIAH